MGGCRIPGPEGRYHLLDLDEGTLCLQPSPLPGPHRFTLLPELREFGSSLLLIDDFGDLTHSDKAEFKVVQKMPVANSRKHAYKKVEDYVADRTLYFGPDYWTFAAESDAELIGTEWGKRKKRTLRSMIEFNKKGQEEQQKIFYRWVRKAYQKRFGDDVNVPELIRKGMSDELEEQIKAVRGSVRVKGIHDENFHAGGFNPRPQKHPVGGRKCYLLGTLSEHATGLAVDIDDKANAQFSGTVWKFIERLTGKHVDRSRWTTEEEATALWTDIRDINNAFVKKVATEVERIEKERADKAAKAPKETKEKAPSKDPKTALQEVLGDYHDTLHPWVKTGFFALPLELVLELHGHGFTWGVRFSDVDLHHFEIQHKTEKQSAAAAPQTK